MKREIDLLKYLGWFVVLWILIIVWQAQTNLTLPWWGSVFFTVFFVILPATLLSTVSIPGKEVKKR